MLRYPFKSYLFHYGLKFGLPFRLLRRFADFCDASKSPREFLERKRIASELLSNSQWTGFLKRESASRQFRSGEIPGLDRLAEIGREIFYTRCESGSNEIRRPENNPFAMLLQEQDFARYPEILKVALGGPVVEIITSYLGAIPRLDNIDLWVTEPNVDAGGPFGSQLYHLDKPEQHYVSLFVNVFEVTEKNGPLTFLPAQITDQVRRETSYEKIYYHGNGRLSDDELMRHIKPENFVRLTGPSGAGGIVDTSECFHCGSRCAAGRRVVFVMRFMPAHKGTPHASSGLRKFLASPNRVTDLLLGEFGGKDRIGSGLT